MSKKKVNQTKNNTCDDSREVVLDYFDSYRTLTPHEILEVMGSMHQFVINHMTDEQWNDYLTLREKLSIPGSAKLVEETASKLDRGVV